MDTSSFQATAVVGTSFAGVGRKLVVVAGRTLVGAGRTLAGADSSRTFRLTLFMLLPMYQ